MKKTLLALAVLFLTMALVMSCASSGSSSGGAAPAAASAATGDLGAFNLRLDDNFQYGEGYSGSIMGTRFLASGSTFAVGDVYNLKVTYSASRDLEDEVLVMIVDQTEAANWWTELADTSDPGMTIPASKAGEVVSADITFTITANPIGSGGSANVIVFDTGGEGVPGRAGSGVKKPVTLAFTEWVLTKVQ